MQAMRVTLNTVATGYSPNTPFGTWNATASPQYGSFLNAAQSSNQYRCYANSILFSNTSPVNYLAGTVVGGVLPPGDPGEYIGMDPAVFEQFIGTRSAYMAQGGFISCNSLDGYVNGGPKQLSDVDRFGGDIPVFLCEIPAPVAGGTSVRVQAGCGFEVTTESQIYRPVNTLKDTDCLDALSALYVPDSIITENPLHAKVVTKRIAQMLEKYLNKAKADVNHNTVRSIIGQYPSIMQSGKPSRGRGRGNRSTGPPPQRKLPPQAKADEYYDEDCEW